MDIALRGLVYFIVSLIIMIIFVFIARKEEERKEKEEKRIDELDNIWLERKTRARTSIYEFRKKAHLINPITFTNGITVTFVEKRDLISYYQESVKFGVEYEVRGESYYDIISYDGTLPYIHIDDKYSLEELKGYDWIIETAYNLTEDRLNKMKEEKIKEELFVKSVKNNDVVVKINQ